MLFNNLNVLAYNADIVMIIDIDRVDFKNNFAKQIEPRIVFTFDEFPNQKCLCHEFH